MQDTNPKRAEALSGKQSKVLALLVSGQSIEAAAAAGATNAATVHRWLKEEAFAGEYKRARREVVSQATATLQAACNAAASTLREICEDTNAPASSRVSAARSIFELGQRGVEIEDLAERIALLEAATGEAKP
jgi:uncharacterized protein (UPF0147 family)